ncbi:MAG: cytochrome d ubiquinol oxidase subunit II [Fimbriimonadaceae bacterium]|nr:cytochrome d ubiquinol oxidase subunit II [Fimbriimonadaceae bacterium]
MFHPDVLPIVWFVLVGVLLTGYAILDGFDLGVGALHLFTKKDEDRRVLLNAIGPVWDGNEVWLLTGGGALFAAFPDVYATVFSGFYTAFMLLLGMLIFRAVAIEFRSKMPGVRWRKSWDVAFSVSSIVLPILMGVALGNVIMGLPIDGEMEYTGNFWQLLTPYPIILGVTTLALFMNHGAIYLSLKTEGDLRDMVGSWVKKTMAFFFVSFLVLTAATFLMAPRMAEKIQANPILWALPVAMFLLLLNVPREIHHKRDFLAFLSSTGAIVCMLSLVGIGMFPNLVPAQELANSLTINNTASSTNTLTVMLWIALIGVPFVLAYTGGIYWVFRGRVDKAHLHY